MRALLRRAKCMDANPSSSIYNPPEMMSTHEERELEAQSDKPLIKDMGNLRIRLATIEDLPQVADVVAQAMLNDEVFNYICPKRFQYYSHYRDSFLRRIKQSYITPGWILCVAVLRNGESEGMIVGYSAWERIGNDKQAKKWRKPKEGIWNGLERTLLNITNNYYSIFNLDYSVDKERLALYHSNAAKCFPFEDFPEVWYLQFLAVHPPYQRNGIGRHLVEWGLEQAETEDMAVGLESSVRAVQFYERLGFQKVKETETSIGLWLNAMAWIPDMIL